MYFKFAIFIYFIKAMKSDIIKRGKKGKSTHMVAENMKKGERKKKKKQELVSWLSLRLGRVKIVRIDKN